LTTWIIIGGGFSGTMTAAHLLRRVAAALSGGAPVDPVEITLVERRPPAGRGAAYGTTCLSHLLNVSAGKMSALPEVPGDFIEWARRRDPKARETDYLPRAWYGEYVQALLRDAESAAAPAGRLTCIDGEAAAIDLLSTDTSSESFDGVARTDREPRGEGVVRLTNGRRLRGDRIVLALGNPTPAALPIHDSGHELDDRLINDPWRADALASLPPDAPLLLIGTGLTMLDLVLALEDAGHRRAITALSRRGLLPQVHAVPAAPGTSPAPVAPFNPFAADPRGARPGSPVPSVRGLVHDVRRRAAEAVTQRGDWRGVVDGLRPITQQIWRSWNESERRRFLRHVRPYWEVHRHRVAPQIAHRIGEAVRSGWLRIVAGRLVDVRRQGDRLEVGVRRRGTDRRESLPVSYIINCTGPDSDFGRSTDPLIRHLREAALIQPDPLGLGLLTDERGALLDSAGRPSRVLFTVGPLRKAQLWENTAVPELRVQAADLAARLWNERSAPASQPNRATSVGTAQS